MTKRVTHSLRERLRRYLCRHGIKHRIIPIDRFVCGIELYTWINTSYEGLSETFLGETYVNWMIHQGKRMVEFVGFQPLDEKPEYEPLPTKQPYRKLRRVRYVDDGVDEYQCLVCKDRFKVYSIPDWNFCPCCGVRFDNDVLITRPEGEPRWLFEIEYGIGRGHASKADYYEIRKKFYGADVPKRGWVIEQRQITKRPGKPDEMFSWVTHAIQKRSSPHMLAVVAGYLKACREHEAIEQAEQALDDVHGRWLTVTHEYRARIADLTYLGGSTIYTHHTEGKRLIDVWNQRAW